LLMLIHARTPTPTLTLAPSRLPILQH